MIAGIGLHRVGHAVLPLLKTHQSNIEWENSNCPLHVEEGVFPSLDPLWRKSHLPRIVGVCFAEGDFSTRWGA